MNELRWERPEVGKPTHRGWGLFLGLALLVGAVVVLLVHPSATYIKDPSVLGTPVGTPEDVARTICISPLNAWTGHGYPSPVNQTVLQQANQNTAYDACWVQIHDRGDLAIALAVGSLIVFLLIVRFARINRSAPAHAPRHL